MLNPNVSTSEDPPHKKPRLENPSPSSHLLLLPNEITVNCLARVPRSYHPSISLVSKALHKLIHSPEIYIERSLLRRNEHVLYVVLRSHATETPRWYNLNLKPFLNQTGINRVPELINPVPELMNQTSIPVTELMNQSSIPVPELMNQSSIPVPEIMNPVKELMNRSLIPVSAFPKIPCWGMSIVAVDSEVYVIGGCINNKLVKTVFVVDCPSYSVRYLPKMKVARGCAAAGIVDGKLYVIGGCNRKSKHWVEAFDFVTQTWESVVGLNKVDIYEKTIRSFVLKGKICIMDRKNSFVYDVRGGKLESDEVLDTQWSVGSCVIDEKVFTFGSRNKIWMFDPVARVWVRVKGLDELIDRPDGSRMVNLGGKLVVLYNMTKYKTEIQCVEIELEWKGGEIWGKVLASNRVLSLPASCTIVQALAVTF